ncbi:uncharacterized protein N7479_003906 [Penicillium vulpinum]|uniref:DDE-1 domain-containing protein n=1 Tax=Penicillium vulpinum TaxID=29845 RepID=A0A1V6RGD4_9EURO|nr:uncharacterized protein N7479_003906 [Penicillium vulpinum]KAJ5964030.1 hypothetical protein N7479_003906 [Penicillium vulpinum]OQE00875.1 hypothetical protein PENVUL_c045G03910 [Penicillium vulpinum]
MSTRRRPHVPSTNCALARTNRRSGLQHGVNIISGLQVSNDQDKAIIEYVERWMEHGFQLKKQSIVSQIASAYLKHQGAPDNGTSRHGGIFSRNQNFHEEIKKFRKLEIGGLASKDPELEDERLCKFIDQFGAIREKYGLDDEHIYALSDTGYATAIQKDKQPLSIRRKRPSENRTLASVIYCYPARGKPLLPYVTFKSSEVQAPKCTVGVKISYNTTGWAENAHALDWLNNVFMKEIESSQSGMRGSSQYRLLLVDNLFPVTPEFFVTCWEIKVICLCVPQKGSEYLSPFENGIFDGLDKLYAEHMKKQLREKQEESLRDGQRGRQREKLPYTISASQFAIFICRELGSVVRVTESKRAWLNTCLLPPSQERLINRRKGDRIRSQTVEPSSPLRGRRRRGSFDETNYTELTTNDNNTRLPSPSRTRSTNRHTCDRTRARTVEPSNLIRSRRRRISPDETSDTERSTADNPIAVIVHRDQIASPESVQGPQLRNPSEWEVLEQQEVSENSSDTEWSEQSSSEDEKSYTSANVPATPCRTPNRLKTPRSSRKLETLLSSVMSLEDFQNCVEQYENASSPADKKRRREQITLGYAKCIWKLEDAIQSPPGSSSKKSRTH